MMDSEEKNIMDEFKEAITDELNSTEETQYENTTLESKIEINNEGLDTNVDEVINNFENKEENNTQNVFTSNEEDIESNITNNTRHNKNTLLILIIIILIMIILGISAYFVFAK